MAHVEQNTLKGTMASLRTLKGIYDGNDKKRYGFKGDIHCKPRHGKGDALKLLTY